MAVVMEFKQGVQCVYVCVLVTATARCGMLQIIYACVCGGFCMQDYVHVALMCWCPRDCVCLQCIYCGFHCHLNLTFKLNDAEIQI